MKIAQQKSTSTDAASSDARVLTRGAFTLVELLVVMGVILVIVAAAVPAISALSGSRSIQAGQNAISAMLGTARARAIGLQQNTGVVFFYDILTRRMVMGLVVYDTNPAAITSQVELIPNFELEPLPAGVGVQFLYSPNPADPSVDRYISTPGLIMFDGRGALLYTPYGIRRGSTLATRMGLNFVFPRTGLIQVPMTQIGVVLYDAETFRAQGFDPTAGSQTYSATDNVFGGPAYVSNATPGTDESSEENWLDTNGTQLLINRYNGTFLRSEPQ